MPKTKKNVKKAKKSKGFNKLVLIPVILVLAVLGVVGYYLYDFMNDRDYVITTVISGTSTEVTVTVNKGKVTTELTEPVITGYTFGGWFSDQEFKTPYDRNKNFVKIAFYEPITAIYAKMDIIQFAETFNSNGGSAVNLINYNYGTLPIEPDYPSRADYLFSGWYSEVELLNRYEFDEVINSDIELFAGWVLISDALTYTINSNIVTITGYKAEIPEYFIVPSVIEGLAVTNIAMGAFLECTKIVEAVVPTFPVEMGPYIFSGCTNLKELSIPLLDIPSPNTTLSYYFGGSYYSVPASLKTVNVNEGVSRIYTAAFYGCENIETINLPESLIIIGDFAFLHCISLNSINIPDSVTTIGERAFHECYSLTEITIPEGVTVLSVGLFYYCNTLTDVNLPESLTRIESYAFDHCIALDNIIIPESVSIIGDYAFSYCTNLLNITLPESLLILNNNTFYQCTSLQSVSLPDTITEIKYSVFSNCSQLTTINLPESITAIGESAFAFCGKLNNIVMPSGITVIKGYTFSQCSLLSNITLPSNLTTIEGYAFIACSALTEIIIPQNVTEIKDYAFGGSMNLDTVTMNSVAPPTIYIYSFYWSNQYLIIKVPSASVDAYKAAAIWSDSSSKIVAIS